MRQQEAILGASDKPHYRCDLSETSLPEILYTIDRFQVAGIIEARSGDVSKRIYIREGNVLHASSSDLGDSLGAFLKIGGRLSERDFDALMKERRSSTDRLGVLLVERNYLSPAEVSQAIREHIEAIVWSLFFWRKGEVTFRIGEVGNHGSVPIQLPMGRVIHEGIKKAPEAKELVARLGTRDAIYEPCFQTEFLIEIGLAREDYQLLGLVDGQRTLYDLCSVGPMNPADNAKVLYAFQVMQIIRKRSTEGRGPETPVEEPEKAEEPEKPIKVRLKTPGDRFSG